MPADVTSPEANDRATAVAIADAHAFATSSIAAAEGSSAASVAQIQVLEIINSASLQVQARLSIAAAQVSEIYSLGFSQAEYHYAEGFISSDETLTTANYQVIEIAQQASVDAGTTRDEAYAQVAAIYGENYQRVRSETQIAKIQADTATSEAYLVSANTTAETESHVQEILGTAAARVSEAKAIADSEAAEILAIVRIEDDATTYGAQAQSNAALSVSTIDANASVKVETIQSKATLYVSARQSDATHADADSHSRLDRSGADQDHDSAIAVANTRQSADEHSADDRYAGVLAHEDGEDHRLFEKLAYADARFNEVFPFVMRSLAAGPLDAPQSPGLSPHYPPTPIFGVFTPRMVQAQANRAYSESDLGLASGYRKAQADVSGRGLSGNSPFLDAIRVGLVSRSIRDGNRGAAGARIAAARANANRILESHKLRGQTFTDRNRVALESEGVQVDRQVGLLKGVAEIVAGLS